MEQQQLNLGGYTLTFTAPSGHEYTIREQNGADDDVISNPSEAASLINISRFIAGIVVKTNYTENGKLTVEQAHNMPSLDRYAILISSRILSNGQELEFEFDWGPDRGGKTQYCQDLSEYLFDYSKEVDESMLMSKPNAIRPYPLKDKSKDIEIKLSSGKEVKFDLLTGASESYLVNLPLEQRTQNKSLIARNICLLVDGKWEKISSFHLFSTKDMREIRGNVRVIDPEFSGICTISNPFDGMSSDINIMAIKDFFYPGEI